MECNPPTHGNTSGCSRCLLPPPRLCCDIHTSSLATAFDVAPPQTTRLPVRSRIDKKYAMTPNDFKLHTALQDWRDEKTEKEFGRAHLLDLGGTLVMPNAVLDRIVDCAHHFKIDTKEDLARETRWDESEAWGVEIVQLIRYHIPKPQPRSLTTLAPIQPASSDHDIASAPAPVGRGKERAKQKCSACGLLGHNSLFHLLCLRRLY